MIVERLFLALPRGCLPFVVVVFPDHTHLLFLLGCGPYYGKYLDIWHMQPRTNGVVQTAPKLLTACKLSAHLNALLKRFTFKHFCNNLAYFKAKSASKTGYYFILSAYLYLEFRLMN